VPRYKVSIDYIKGLLHEEADDDSNCAMFDWTVDDAPSDEVAIQQALVELRERGEVLDILDVTAEIVL
jgi:hypothetical protein